MSSYRPISVPAAARRPGQTAALLLFLAVLVGVVSPLSGLIEPGAGFPSAGDLAAAARRAGYLGSVLRRPGAASPGQTLQAVLRRQQLPAGQRARLDGLLAGASADAQGYLAEAFAAGHTVAEVAAFASVVAGRSPIWLRRRLSPVDPGEVGPVEFHGTSISQYDGTTCGPTTIVVARMVTDPLYALYLTTGVRPGTAVLPDEGFQQRLRDQEQQIHDETDLLWPQPAGTPPWGMSGVLDRRPADLSVHYRWTPVLPGLALGAGAVIQRALTAADRGYPVPMLIGDLIPRHYVLLLRHDDAGAWFYEPTAGAVRVVSDTDLRDRDFSALGYPRLKGVILPSR